MLFLARFQASMDEVGQALLQSQVEHLSHKLMVLKDALGILNSRAEVRKKAHQRCHDQIQKSRSNLKDMRHVSELIGLSSEPILSMKTFIPYFRPSSLLSPRVMSTQQHPMSNSRNLGTNFWH